MAYLCSGDLPVDIFLSTITSYPWPKEAVVVAFTPSEARLDRFTYDERFYTATEQGRIFFPGGELHWRRMGAAIRTVYLGESPPPANLEDLSNALNGLTPSQRQLLIWGERSDTDAVWLEQQVPHRFSYPINSAEFPRGRAALVIEDWSDDTGIPRFSRYHGIIEVKGGL